jgi:hypothetical protein
VQCPLLRFVVWAKERPGHTPNVHRPEIVEPMDVLVPTLEEDFVFTRAVDHGVSLALVRDVARGV